MISKTVQFTMIVVLLIMAVVAQSQTAILESEFRKAPLLKMEALCAPIKTVRVGNTLMAYDKRYGTWDSLQVYFTNYGGPNEIIIINGADAGIQHVKIPIQPYKMQWHMCQSLTAPNGKLFIYTGGLTPLLHIYDPESGKLSVAAVKLPEAFHSPAHGHPMTLGPDGKIYCAAGYGDKGFGFCRVDPDTLKVEDFGAVGDPKYGRNLPWSIAVDKTHAYIVGAKLPWSAATYDLKTHETNTLFAGGLEMDVKQTPFGCILTVHGGKHAGTYYLDNGKAIPTNDAPPEWVSLWNKSKHKKDPLAKPRLKPAVFTGQALPNRDGKCVLWVKYPLTTSQSAARTSDATQWRKIVYTVDTTLCGISRIIALPTGVIFGTGSAYGGEFQYDPEKSECVFLGKEHVNVYTLSILGNTLFLSGYPSSATFAYDFTKPWLKPVGGYPPFVTHLKDDDPRQNPRFIGYLAKEAHTHKMYASAVGSDGRIYFGGRMMRDGSGGGLAWYDPKTDAKGGIHDIFSNYQIRYMTSADDGRYVVISAHSTDDQTLRKPKPACGRIFVFDTKQGKIVRTVDPLPNCLDVGTIADGGDQCVVGLTFPNDDKNATVFYRVNVATGKLKFAHKLGVPINLEHYGNETEAFDFTRGPDGKIWTFLKTYYLTRIDPYTGNVEVIGKLPSLGGRMAFMGNDIYFSGSVYLRRISNIVMEREK